MKKPGFFSVEFQNELVNDLEIAHHTSAEFPEHLIMVSGNINDLGAAGVEFDDLMDHIQVGLWKITFPKLPDINDIPIQNKFLGLDRIQIFQEFPGVAAECSKVNI